MANLSSSQPASQSDSPHFSPTDSTFISPKELQLIEKALKWPAPPTSVTAVNQSTSPYTSSYVLQNPCKSYSVGDIITVVIMARDGLNNSKVYGGDFFQAKLFNTEFKASVYGEVVDHHNGTYTATFKLLWEGQAKVSIRLIHSSEAVEVLLRHRERDPDKVFFTGVFRGLHHQETVVCNAQRSERLLKASHCCCEYRHPITGESWFCRRPNHLPCSAWVDHDMGGYQAQLSKLEYTLLHSKYTNKILPGEDITVNVSHHDMDVGLDTPSPAGFYLHDNWMSLMCRTQSFPTAIQTVACLKDKQVLMMGDSTLRQWYEYLLKTVPTLKQLNLFTSAKSGPFEAVDIGNNIRLVWRAHGLPIRTSLTPRADLHHIASEVDALAGGQHSVVIFTIWAHFTTFPLATYLQRLAGIRRSVLALLQRAPQTLVLIKSANTGYKDIYGSDWLSWQLDRLDTPSPAGFYLHDNWMSLMCRTQSFPTAIQTVACLKDKQVLMMGDSTLRQWYEHLLKTVPTLKQLNLFTSAKKSGPFEAVDIGNNIRLVWRAHGLPIRTSLTPRADLHHIASEVDALAGGQHSVVIFTIWAHFTTFPLATYLQRLAGIRRSVLALLQRAPQTLVLIKSANTGYKDIYGSDWLSWQLDRLDTPSPAGFYLHDNWMSLMCRTQSFPTAIQTVACLKDKQVLMMGDSTLRQWYEYLLKTVPTLKQLNLFTSAKSGPFEAVDIGNNIRLVWRAHGLPIRTSLTPRADLHHIASEVDALAGGQHSVVIFTIWAHFTTFPLATYLQRLAGIRRSVLALLQRAPQTLVLIKSANTGYKDIYGSDWLSWQLDRLDTPSPAGFYLHDNWMSLMCRTQSFPTAIQTVACLKDKQVLMMGDSTLRQWYEYLLKTVPTLKQLNLFTSAKSGPFEAVDIGNNIRLVWRAHGLPIRTSLTPRADLHHIASEVDALAGGQHSVVIFTIWAHFTTFPLATYLQRLAGIRRSVLALLQRAPQTLVLIKSANTGYKDIYGSDWLSWQLDRLDTPSPAGFYLHDNWMSLMCRTQSFPTAIQTVACLKDKQVLMMGDSTLRQWYEYLLKTVPTLKQLNLFTSAKSGPFEAVDIGNNIRLVWRAHGLPIRTSLTPRADLHHIASEVDALAGGQHSVVIFTIGAHFTTFPLATYLQRLAGIRRSVLALLQRAPQTLVLIKSANTGYKDIYGSDWLSWQLDRLDTPSPAGFYLHDNWMSLMCRTQSFPTAIQTVACLKDKQVLMMGDSTLRQWYEYLLKTVPTLKQLNLFTSAKSGPFEAVDIGNNIRLVWRAHGLPIRTSLTPRADLHHIASEVDALAGGQHSVVIFTIWAHFTTFPLATYLQRLAGIRRSVLALLQRAPQTLVLIKSANTGYKDIYGSDWLSWQLDRLDTPSPAGFYLHDNWMSLMCRTQSFPTAIQTVACLKDKQVLMMGDSTLRQWYEYLLKTVPTLKQLNLFTSAKSGPFEAVDIGNNIRLVWRAHGLPIRTSLTPRADLHHIASEVDALAGGQHSVVIFTIWAHFTTFPLATYLQRLAGIRRSVLALLQRAPQTLVLIKSANTGYKDIYGSDWLSWQLDRALRMMFRELPVVIIDVWQMTSCHYSPDNIHPSHQVIKNEVDLFLSFVCPR
ncbi:hypothetical protein AOLI_G00174280 [Acnodon oligacanthus]